MKPTNITHWSGKPTHGLEMKAGRLTPVDRERQNKITIGNKTVVTRPAPATLVDTPQASTKDMNQ